MSAFTVSTAEFPLISAAIKPRHRKDAAAGVGDDPGWSLIAWLVSSSLLALLALFGYVIARLSGAPEPVRVLLACAIVVGLASVAIFVAAWFCTRVTRNRTGEIIGMQREQAKLLAGLATQVNAVGDDQARVWAELRALPEDVRAAAAAPPAVLTERVDFLAARIEDAMTLIKVSTMDDGDDRVTPIRPNGRPTRPT